MEYDTKEVGDIGFEMEFVSVRRDTDRFVSKLHNKCGDYKIVHDASVETPEVTLSGVPIQFEINGNVNKLFSVLPKTSLELFGGELTSPILKGDNLAWRTHIYNLVDFLQEIGESNSTEKDKRGSLHIHINVSKDITHKHLLRLLETGLGTESIFFRLGGMGSINRGIYNNFIYQRPLTMPPCVKSNGRYYPIFDYKDLLTSENKADFYEKYGDTVYCINNGNHYVTQRYVGLNFYSIPYRGSIEFRYANKCLVPEWIIAYIVLCQKFVEYSLTKPKTGFENTYRKLEDNRDIPDDEFISVLENLGVPDTFKVTLLDVWRESKTPTFDGVHRLTHLSPLTFFSGRYSNYLPKEVEFAKSSEVIDERNLRESRNLKLSKVKKLDKKSFETDYTLVPMPNGKDKKSTNLYEIDYSKMFTHATSSTNSFSEVLSSDETLDNVAQHFHRQNFEIIPNWRNLDAIRYIENRIQNIESVPFFILRKNSWYMFHTNYNNISLAIKVNSEDDIFQWYVYNERINRYSPTYQFSSSILHEFGDTYGYNLNSDIRNILTTDNTLTLTTPEEDIPFGNGIIPEDSIEREFDVQEDDIDNIEDFGDGENV